MELFGHILYTHENRRTNSRGILVSFGCFYFLFIQFIIVLMCLCLCKNNKKQNKTKTKNKKTLKKQINKKCFRNTYAPPLVQNSKLPCTKFGIDQMKWSQDSERTTLWAEKSYLTLTFKHVTWKSIRIIYSLRATLYQVWYWSSQGVKRYWADNTLGSKVIWTWPLNMWPENQ